MFSPEYDDPANMGDEYGSQYGQYGAPYEQYESRASMAGRSIGTIIIILLNTELMIHCSLTCIYIRIYRLNISTYITYYVCL